ncbi:peptidase family M48 [Colletotrichum graminicola]|uniref:Peptidase family M48 n=1 Tax=Colletotrichum graminicola (strain M1.001 / M2 / FGSC 10212) TaxID=645133 RepID=E3QDY8_COLGM|nr:peptidase family M48 [Colletotrichum graminicola M1.001]EFQ29076.1 peptidase family M48 [Colletotrichum graminicola M1.001]WDK20183.1 peptidase family M48 [Colletotrichum graminicola]
MIPFRIFLRSPALRAAHHLPPARSLVGVSSPSSTLPRPRARIPPLPTTRNAVKPRFFSQTARRPHPPPTGGYDPRNPAHREILHEYRLRTARPLVTVENLRRLAKSRLTHVAVAVLCLWCAGYVYYNIQTVPVSGRRRFNCYSEASINKLSEQQVRHVIYEIESQGGRFLPSWDPRSQMVARVMRRLIPVSGLDSQEWEVRVIDDPHTLNAFVLPGGKVFVHSGILRMTRNEDGLAAVLGHEIAHNLAQHVGERMSSSFASNLLLGGLVALSGWLPPAIILTHYLGSGLMDYLFSRPMSRVQESEADYIGMMLMAEACYDPREAIAFWRRMDAEATREQTHVPDFLSTHPSNEQRVEKCKEWMPKAIERWEASDCNGTARFANVFRRALNRGFIISEL